MKLSSLFTVLALAGTAATSYADNPYAHRYDAHGGVQVRFGIRREHYNRFEQSHWRNDIGDRWVMISNAYSAREPRQEVDMMGQGGGFNLVRIEGVAGAPIINRVTIQFMNNESQVVDLNARLAPGQGEVIDLTGTNRRIKRVMVYPQPGSRGAYAIFGA